MEADYVYNLRAALSVVERSFGHEFCNATPINPEGSPIWVKVFLDIIINEL